MLKPAYPSYAAHWFWSPEYLGMSILQYPKLTWFQEFALSRSTHWWPKITPVNYPSLSSTGRYKSVVQWRCRSMLAARSWRSARSYCICQRAAMLGWGQLSYRSGESVEFKLYISNLMGIMLMDWSGIFTKILVLCLWINMGICYRICNQQSSTSKYPYWSIRII